MHDQTTTPEAVGHPPSADVPNGAEAGASGATSIAAQATTTVSNVEPTESAAADPRRIALARVRAEQDGVEQEGTADAAEAADAASSRGADGRFTSRQEGQTGAATSAGETSEDLSLPQSWPRQMESQWSAMPADTKKYLAARDEQINHEFARRTHEHKRVVDELQAWEPISAVLQKYKDNLQVWGGTVSDNLDKMFTMVARMDPDPLGGIVDQVKAYKLDPALVIAALGGSSMDPLADPEQIRRDTETDRLRRQTELSARQLQVYREHQQAQQRAAVERYERQQREDVDRREYAQVDQVYQTMVSEMPYLADRDVKVAVAKHLEVLDHQGTGGDLQSAMKVAYDAALWALPKHRQRLLAEHTKAESTKRSASARKAAASANAAMSVNVREHHASGGSAAASLLDIQRAALARVRSTDQHA
jgi:hypothetical protein